MNGGEIVCVYFSREQTSVKFLPFDEKQENCLLLLFSQLLSTHFRCSINLIAIPLFTTEEEISTNNFSFYLRLKIAFEIASLRDKNTVFNNIFELFSRLPLLR